MRGSHRSLLALLVLLPAVGLGATCSSVPPPRSDALAERSERMPVILVPGITGSVLEDRTTGKVAWGRGINLVAPWDGGHSLALPVVAGTPDDRPLETDLHSPRVLEKVSLLGLSKPVYGPLIRLLEDHGYRRGNLERPRPGDDLFGFAYDWRQDKIANARRLAELLERLVRVRGAAGGLPAGPRPLRVTLICQSCGAHLCRWLAKYGAATLEEAEAGEAEPPAGVEVAKLVLVGSSNGGSLRILRELDRGRRYVPLGRRWQPETLFTFRALFQDLPVYRTGLFVDEEGEPLDADLWDAELWQRWRLSIFHPRAQRRIAASRHRERFGTVAEQRAYLGRMLDRSRRVHRLLKRDSPTFRNTLYFAIQDPVTPTPDRAAWMAGRSGEHRLVFTGDKALKKHPRLAGLLSAPGDEHATVASQTWLSRQETLALEDRTLHASGGHFELLLDPGAQQRFLEILAW